MTSEAGKQGANAEQAVRREINDAKRLVRVTSLCTMYSNPCVCLSQYVLLVVV